MKKITIMLLILAACTSSNYLYEEHTDAGSKYVLKNGMIVILKENPDTGMAAIDLMVKKSIAADGQKHGLGFLTTRALLTGTLTRTREQIRQEIEAVGGTINGRTYAEYTEIIIDVPSDKISVALDILQDIILRPKFDPVEIEKERITLMGELESKKDQPRIVAEELFMETMYEGHPYQHPIDGYVETIQQITREDIIQHYSNWFTPNNIILAIAGNIKEQKTVRAVNYLFGKMQPKQNPDGTILELPSRIQETTATYNMPIESFYIQYGHQLVPATHPDFIKLRMTAAVLGSGSGSRLFYELRDKRALAYSVFAIAPSIRTTGFLKISMISRPEVANQSIEGIRGELEKIKTELVPEEELDLVKRKIRGFFFLDHQRTIDQANYLGLYEMQGYGYHYDVEYPDRIAEVTAEEVQYAANKYFHNPVIATVGPFEEIKIE